jgi:hypothetical protein
MVMYDAPMANQTSEKEERINHIHQRVEELDRLLARFVQPEPADNPRTVNAAELDYFADRREERRLLLEELEGLLRK